MGWVIIQLSRMRLLAYLSSFIEALQGEQAVNKVSVWDHIIGGKPEALAIRLRGFLILPAQSVHVAQIDMCSVVSGVARNLLLICLCRFLQFPGYIAGWPLCRIPRGRSGTTPLLSNSLSLNFLNVSRSHVRRFINTENRKDILSLRRTAGA